jgi:hypothetical protein
MRDTQCPEEERRAWVMTTTMRDTQCPEEERRA